VAGEHLAAAGVTARFNRPAGQGILAGGPCDLCDRQAATGRFRRKFPQTDRRVEAGVLCSETRQNLYGKDDAVKKLITVSALLGIIGLLFPMASAATASAGCTATNGGACTFGHWIVFNNVFGPTPGSYVIHASSQSAWSVTADQNGGGGCGGCAVEAFESAQWNYSNIRYSSIRYLYSSFSQTMPTGSLSKNGFDAEAAYDMFINGSDTDEVMVWVDNQGQTPAGARVAAAVIFGQVFDVYVSGRTKSFVLRRNETRGTVHYLAILSWLHRHRMLAASDTLSQFNFGWEICNTAGVARTFTVHSLTLHQKF
jgi:hypothetical protein